MTRPHTPWLVQILSLGDIQLTRGPRLSNGADIFLPGNVGYDQLAKRYTDFDRPTFAAIVAVASTRDVVEAIQYARTHQFPFLAQSRGHALAGSVVPAQEPIQLNLRRINEVTSLMGVTLEVGLVSGEGCEEQQLGVVTEAVIRTYPQQNGGMHFVADMEFKSTDTAQVFATVNRISTPALPSELAITIVTHYQGDAEPSVLIVNFVWSGPHETSLEYLRVFRDLDPTSSSERSVPWDVPPWVTYRALNRLICDNPGGQNNSYSASLAFYNPSALAKLVQEWEDRNRQSQGHIRFSLMMQTFSNATKAEEDDDAFPWRGKLNHLVSVQAHYTDISFRTEVDKLQKAQRDLLVNASGYGRLQQYVNLGHRLSDPVESLYGSEGTRLHRLWDLKERCDPEGWFNLYQPLRRAPLGCRER
ncbi:hypothetical protein ASPACDRAFT_63447 [Aspergillus aculeatus ATCC 16872]|uniref:FAD linked oxidase N-terminal domain-containing protein n=1 Tax=Aspergillus aculeatus (strain ATCC 16872 / CBS 172.66 / WB 5094) TaxID=690307 RepID=A0A1L9WK49_ASPA1|nr:uncharacterized protein ASPACDRAFT_63447 [Aspergillus aculeatus ATCC 16872]OJJ96528.1 hypothetical protein ASPACDRAFT_63447 [Aspergillus aculeatus ATCC 16872]